MTVDDFMKQHEDYQSKMKLTKEDVFGHEGNERGMIVASSYEQCPIFHDRVPYKSLTVVCKPEDEIEVSYWLNYIHGNGIRKRAELESGEIALRSDYTCW